MKFERLTKDPIFFLVLRLLLLTTVGFSVQLFIVKANVALSLTVNIQYGILDISAIQFISAQILFPNYHAYSFRINDTNKFRQIDDYHIDRRVARETIWFVDLTLLWEIRVALFTIRGSKQKSERTSSYVPDFAIGHFFFKRLYK